MSLNRKSKEQGFTLIEVIVVIAIFSLLMVAMMNLFDWHNRVYFMEVADTKATGSARITMNNMTKYISQASQILTNRTINGTTYTTGSSTIVLQLPSFDSSGNLISNTNDYVVYYTSGTSLYQLISTGSGSSARRSGTKQMSADLLSVTFTYNSSDVTTASQVTVDLQTRATSRGTSTVSAHDKQIIFLRNL